MMELTKYYAGISVLIFSPTGFASLSVSWADEER
jgi:hypothetical protein